MTLQDHLNDKSNIILLFTTRLTNELIEFWNDDYNFECSLRLLNDLSLQQKISSITKTPIINNKDLNINNYYQIYLLDIQSIQSFNQMIYLKN